MARGKKKEKTLTPEEKLMQVLIPKEKQPYSVPENWCWTYGESLFLPMETKKPEGTTFRYIDIDSIDNKLQVVSAPKFLPVNQAPSRASRALHTGDTVFSMVRPYLKNIAFIDESLSDCIASTGFYVCQPISMVNRKFIYYMMISPYVVDGLNSFMKGDNSPSIRKDSLQKFAYPLPPCFEQQRIVDRIESLFNKLNEAKERAQAVVDSSETRKAAILHNAFAGKLSKQWRQQNPLKTKEWMSIPIGDLTDIVSSKRIYKEEYVENGVPFYRSSEIVDLYDAGHTTPIFFISKTRYEQIRKRYGVPSKGDLLVTSVGTIGKTWIVDDREFYYKDGNLTQVKQCDELRTKYLQYFIMSNEFKEQVMDTVSGSTYNALTIVKFKKIILPLPSIDEQDEIVHILDGIFAKEQQAKEISEVVLDQIDTMKKAILARAFRGELGTNDPAEEWAGEMLKSIWGDKECI